MLRAALALFLFSGCADPLDPYSPGFEDTASGPSLDGDTGLPMDTGLPTDGDLRAVVALGPPRVNLGTRANLAGPGAYTLLASTGITNVTGSSVGRGHLGLSPAAASYITGFALVRDATNRFARSPSVAGRARVYAANYAVPTPSNLTSAVAGMQAAYTDAASRTRPDHLNLNSGNLGGLTLTPGLYTWGSSVTVPTNVTLSGGVNDTWILQISNDLDVSAGRSVILAGGARPENIFWQVAGQVTIHANAHFEGIILSQTAVTLQTGASLDGRVLAQTLIALDNNVVMAP